MSILLAPILVIVLDDVGFDLHTFARTPELDRIAAESVVFPRAWSAPACSPWRAQFITGRYPSNGGNRTGRVIQPKHGDAWRLPAYSTLLPNVVDGTASMFGKWHLSDVSSEATHWSECGWDHFLGTNFNLGKENGDTYYGGECWLDGEPSTWNGYLPSIVANAALEAVQREDRLVYVPLHSVHAPFEAPPADLHTYGDLDGADDTALAFAMTEAADTLIGRLYDVARSHGYVVVVTTDNGTSKLIGGAKGSFKEENLRTWLYISGPGIEPYVDQTLVCPTDLYATVAHLANGAVPRGNADAHSLLGHLYPSSWPRSRRTFSYTCRFQNGALDPKSSPDFVAAIRDERWKLVTVEGNPGEVAELYDLDNDGTESTNLWLDPTPEQILAARALLEVMP